jgi:hypothetical protein
MRVETSSEETKQADLSDVETNKEVLQCTWVDRTTSVDTSIVDVKKIVSVCEVKEEDTDSSEQEDKRCNASVANGWRWILVQNLKIVVSQDLPMTNRLVITGKT